MKRDISTISGMYYIATGPKGLVLEKTIGSEVATPTVKRGFVMPKFLSMVCVCTPAELVSGGMGLPVRMATRLNPCFQHPVHLMRLKTQKVASLSRSGAKTMTAITSASCATTPAQGTPDPIQLHATAHNALNMAVFYLRQPQANTVAARRKAVQALAALRGLSLALED